MLFKVICVLSFLTTSAHPLHRNTREAPWADSRANQAHEKTELPKSFETSYKSHIDSSSLYSQVDEANKNSVAAEVQHKLSLESERLRTRLHQELAELREKLFPLPAHKSSTLVSLKERLAPPTQQLYSSLCSNTQDLCMQVSLYLHNMESQTDGSQTLHQRAGQWIGQTLDHSSSKMADIISDFYSQSSTVMGYFKNLRASEGALVPTEFWQKVSSRLTQELGVLQTDAQNSADMLKEELASLITPSYGARVALNQFCQNAELQNQSFQARLERLFVDLEEELEALTDSGMSSPTSSIQHGSLQDYSLKLSSLIQDILHTVQ